MALFVMVFISVQSNLSVSDVVYIFPTRTRALAKLR